MLIKDAYKNLFYVYISKTATAIQRSVKTCKNIYLLLKIWHKEKNKVEQRRKNGNIE